MAPLKRLRDRLSHCKHNCTSCINGTLKKFCQSPFLSPHLGLVSSYKPQQGLKGMDLQVPGLGIWKSWTTQGSVLLIFPTFAAKRLRSCRWESQKQMVISSNKNNATAVNGKARSIHICGEIGDGRTLKMIEKHQIQRLLPKISTVSGKCQPR